MTSSRSTDDWTMELIALFEGQQFLMVEQLGSASQYLHKLIAESDSPTNNRSNLVAALRLYLFEHRESIVSSERSFTMAIELIQSFRPFSGVEFLLQNIEVGKEFNVVIHLMLAIGGFAGDVLSLDLLSEPLIAKYKATLYESLRSKKRMLRAHAAFQTLHLNLVSDSLSPETLAQAVVTDKEDILPSILSAIETEIENSTEAEYRFLTYLGHSAKTVLPADHFRHVLRVLAMYREGADIRFPLSWASTPWLGAVNFYRSIKTSTTTERDTVTLFQSPGVLHRFFQIMAEEEKISKSFEQILFRYISGCEESENNYDLLVKAGFSVSAEGGNIIVRNRKTEKTFTTKQLAISTVTRNLDRNALMKNVLVEAEPSANLFELT